VRSILMAPGAKRSSWRWMHLEQQHSGVLSPVWGQVGKSVILVRCRPNASHGTGGKT
jgi:hypothetical protein